MKSVATRMLHWFSPWKAVFASVAILLISLGILVVVTGKRTIEAFAVRSRTADLGRQRAVHSHDAAYFFSGYAQLFSVAGCSNAYLQAAADTSGAIDQRLQHALEGCLAAYCPLLPTMPAACSPRTGPWTTPMYFAALEQLLSGAFAHDLTLAAQQVQVIVDSAVSAHRSIKEMVVPLGMVQVQLTGTDLEVTLLDSSRRAFHHLLLPSNATSEQLDALMHHLEAEIGPLRGVPLGLRVDKQTTFGEVKRFMAAFDRAGARVEFDTLRPEWDLPVQ